MRLPIVKTFRTIYIEISHDPEMDRGFFVLKTTILYCSLPQNQLAFLKLFV